MKNFNEMTNAELEQAWNNVQSTASKRGYVTRQDWDEIFEIEKVQKERGTLKFETYNED